ncbi:MAG: glycerophosphodiester phosphodiesterase [Bacillus sp. (in: firmicutes)]
MGTLGTMIFAHRGSAGTHPENTMTAFLEAERVGADGIELDVQLSKDGELVVIHDEKLDRTTNGKGFVKDHSLRELKRLDASHSFSGKTGFAAIPTLREVFDMLKQNRMLLNIELKNTKFFYPGMEEKVLQLIDEYGFQDRIIISSFNHYSLVHMYQLAPHIETAPLYTEGLYMPWVYAKAIGAQAMHPHFRAAPGPIIQEALRNGMQVRPYTVNKQELMEKLFNLECSGLITDYPGKAVKIKKKMKRAR